MTRLTDANIKSRKLPASGAEIDWDDLVIGFGVRYTRTVATYVVQWRDPTGPIKRPRIGLGRVGVIKVAEARDMARKRLGEALSQAEAGSGEPLHRAVRAWFKRQAGLDVWRPRYLAKVDALIASYVEGRSARASN